MMKFRSMYTNLLAGSLVLVVATLLFGFTITLRSVLNETRRINEGYMRTVLDIQADRAKEKWNESDKWMDDFCNSFRDELTVLRLTIIDQDGRVRGDSDIDLDELPRLNLRERPEVVAALNGDVGVAVRMSEFLHARYRFVAKPVYRDGELIGVVRLAMPMSDMDAVHHLLFSSVAINFLLTFAASVVLSMVIAWFWSRPLNRLSRQTEDLARGNLTTPITLRGPFDLERLARAMEHMRLRLLSQLTTIRRQRETLQTIFHDLNEAIFALDRNANLVFVNSTAQRFFGNGMPTKLTRLHEWLNADNPEHAQILAFYERMRTEKVEVKGRIRLTLDDGERIFDVEAFPMTLLHQPFLSTDHEVRGDPETPEDSVALLVLRDVTDLARLSEIKSEFVANASHELRTPLATLRAVLDNLLDGVAEDPDAERRLLDLLDRHLTRMETMVNDLLDLHTLSRGPEACRMVVIETPQVLDSLWELFAAKAWDRDVTLEFSGNASRFESDLKRLYLVLQNLVDNALKFTPPGGRVFLSINRDKRSSGNPAGEDGTSDTCEPHDADGIPNEDRDPGDVLIVCQDSGCGISEKEQHKVFERFYQASLSRNRDNRFRGTGLGLAIVKHAVECLHGEIELSSTPGQGTRITIRLPQGPSFPATEG